MIHSYIFCLSLTIFVEDRYKIWRLVLLLLLWALSAARNLDVALLPSSGVMNSCILHTTWIFPPISSVLIMTLFKVFIILPFSDKFQFFKRQLKNVHLCLSEDGDQTSVA